MTRRGWGILSLLLVGSLLPAAAGAQLPNPSAVALGMGENHAALARGYSAISTNPAGLGAPGGPGSSFALLSVRGIGGIGPVGLDELDAYEGGLPSAVTLGVLADAAEAADAPDDYVAGLRRRPCRSTGL